MIEQGIYFVCENCFVKFLVNYSNFVEKKNLFAKKNTCYKETTEISHFYHRHLISHILDFNQNLKNILPKN